MTQTGSLVLISTVSFGCYSLSHEEAARLAEEFRDEVETLHSLPQNYGEIAESDQLKASWVEKARVAFSSGSIVGFWMQHDDGDCNRRRRALFSPPHNVAIWAQFERFVSGGAWGWAAPRSKDLYFFRRRGTGRSEIVMFVKSSRVRQ